MIRRLNMFFLVAVLLCLLPVTASAAETVASGSCGPSVNWIFTDDGKLTISGTGDMDSFSYNTDYPFNSYRTQITSLEICEGVTSIGKGAFTYYDLSDLKLPSSLISIGDNAFAGGALASFTYLRLPEGLRTIGNGVFTGAENIVSLTLPSTLTSIGNNAFTGFKKLVSVTCLASSPPSCGSNIFYSFSSLTRIIVPEGTEEVYKSASGWSTYSGFITDGLSDPNVFSVYTSWADQYIYIDSGEIVNLYFIADGVNGSVSVDWYSNGQLIDSFPVNTWLDNDTVIAGYEYNPGADGSRLLHAVINNTIGSNIESVMTPSCTIVVGQGIGSGSTDSDRFDQIDMELTQVKDAIAEVNGKVDGLSDQLDELQSGGSAGDALTDQSDQLADDLAGIDEFEQSQMDILDSGMVQIKESVSFTSFIPALAFVQRYADMTFDSVFDISIIFYLPMFLGLFFFLCSRVPYAVNSGKRSKNKQG